MTRVLKHVLLALTYGALVAVVAAVTTYVYILEDRPDLSVWHVVELDEEFDA